MTSAVPQTPGRLAIVVLTYLRTARPRPAAAAARASRSRSVGHDDFGAILVVDNDPAGSAADVVASTASPLVRYVHEPATGIAHARNRALDETVDDELLIFIDDDERPMDGWLAAMLRRLRAAPAGGRHRTVVPRVRDRSGSRGWSPAASSSGGSSPTVIACPPRDRATCCSTSTQVRRLGSALRRAVRADRRIGHPVHPPADRRAAGSWCSRRAAGVIDKVPASRMTRAWTLRRQYRVGTTWSRTSVELAPPGFTPAVEPGCALTAGGGGPGRGRCARATPTGGPPGRSPIRPGAAGPAPGAGRSQRVPGAARSPSTSARPGRPVSDPGSSPASAAGYRFARKKAKRAWSHVWLAGLRSSGTA